MLQQKLVDFTKNILVSLAAWALFVVYFWFGILKVFDLSPASELIHDLFVRTIPFMDFGVFMILFGLYEMLIGILFLFKKTARIGFYLFLPHLVMTTMPLVLVPGLWSLPFVPTLEGQYIIKNLLLLACAVLVFSTTGSKVENAPQI